MKTTLEHLPDFIQEELQAVKEQIITSKDVGMIILYGSFARGNYKLERGKVQGKKSDYDILIITETLKQKKLVESKFSGQFSSYERPIQFIVEPISKVNKFLREDQFFFSDIKREGIILFDAKQFELAEAEELTKEERLKIAQEDFDTWYKKAEDFLWGYNQYKGANKFQIASFNLQQTVEMCYTTIELVFNHYNPHEHDLVELRDRVLKFDRSIENILPRNTQEEIDLFDYLNFAYIGGRYRSEEEFPVTVDQLDYWEKEVGDLISVTQEICLKFFQAN